MGYDLSVRFRSKALRDAMGDFLSSQSSLFQAHAKALLLLNDTASQPVRGEDLGAYVPGHRPRRLGYAVNVAQDWHWAVLTWMAQRSQDLDAKGHPGVWYDNQRFPLTSPASTQEGVSVDPRGHFIFPKTPLFNIFSYLPPRRRMARATRKLIQELDTAWEVAQVPAAKSTGPR